MQRGQLQILILVGIMIIAAIAGGAYYLGRSTLKPSPIPVVTPQPTLIRDSSDGIRKSLDDEIVYSIPKDWIKEIHTYDNQTWINISSLDYIPEGIAHTKQGMSIDITKYDSEDAPCGFVDTAGVSEPINTSINDIPAITQVITYEGYQIRYCFTKAESVYDIRFNLKESDKDRYQKVIEEFLSSIQLIN